MATNNATNTSNPITVPQGGTGVASTTAYGVVCGGTTSTGNLQNAGAGTSGQLLKSNGASSLPTWASAASSGGSLVLLSSQSASSVASIQFTTITSYRNYLLTFDDASPATDSDYFLMQISNNNGSTWVATGYLASCVSFALDAGSPTLSGNAQTTGFPITGSMASGGGNKSANGFFYIQDANQARECMVSGTCTFWDKTAGKPKGASICGQAGDTGANSFQILCSSGNISTGLFNLYGIAIA